MVLGETGLGFRHCWMTLGELLGSVTESLSPIYTHLQDGTNEVTLTTILSEFYNTVCKQKMAPTHTWGS